MIPISDLTGVAYNPRTITRDALERLATSIREHTRGVSDWDPASGFRLATSITVNKQGGRVIGGNQRVVALRDVLGQDWIHDDDVRWMDYEPDSPEERALNLVLNARDAQGEFEWQGVSEMLKELEASDVNLDLTGFAPETLEPLLAATWSPPDVDPDASTGGDSDEWYTPAKILDLARRVLGSIDLDPATSEHAQKTVSARKYYTKEHDGLVQEWHGSVWLNPPYSMPLVAQFVDKLLGEHDAGRTTHAVCLVNNATDSNWFHSMLTRQPACFISGRISFEHASGRESKTPRQGQVAFYLGRDPDLFVEVFQAVGTVVGKI